MILVNIALERCVLEMFGFFQSEYFRFIQVITVIVQVITVIVIVAAPILNAKVIAKHRNDKGFSVKQYMLFIVAIPFIASGILQTICFLAIQE
jgi:hypothetical protein